LVYGEIAVTNAHVTDVTSSSFSLVWHSSSPSYPQISLYEDELGSIPVTAPYEVIVNPVYVSLVQYENHYQKINSEHSLRQTIHQKGLNKIEVRGLSPDTDYFISLDIRDESDSGVWPATGLVKATTQKENTFINNGSLLVIDVNEPESAGWIALVSHADTSYAISSFVDSYDNNGKTVLNLSNLFGDIGFNWYGGVDEPFTVTLLKANGEAVTENFTVTMSPEFGVSQRFSAAIGTPFDALIQIISPNEKVYTRGESVQLAWTDTAESVNATISLYLDSDQSGEDGQLIVSGIEEDPDGVSDIHELDVTNIVDGAYYVYAVMSDGQNQVVSYGAEKITIDKLMVDGDGDSMSDLWESHYFDSYERDGTGDFDLDGIPDALESFYNTLPDATNDPLQGLTHSLKQGDQIIGVPGALVPKLTAFDVISQLGNSVVSISRFNTKTQEFEVASLENSSSTGIDFTLMPGEGYAIRMKEDDELVWSPFDVDRDISLKQGVNVVAITHPQGDAFGLLDQLGEDVIWSIRRINPKTSLSETAAFDGTDKVGKPFNLNYGEGYILTIKQGSVLP
jgi:hypothetical protein